jgi:hypothetical protein
MQFIKYREVRIQNVMPDLKAKLQKWFCDGGAVQTRNTHASQWCATSCSKLKNVKDISAHSIHCTPAHTLISIKQKHTLLQLYIRHFPKYKITYKEHICLWVIVRQHFVSCTQVNTVYMVTTFWCQVNFALIKLLTKSKNDILSVCLSVLYSHPLISLPSCKLIMSISQH